MLSLFFGLPGCGKTTLLVKLALQATKRYEHVYVNFDQHIPGVTRILNSDVGRYDLRNCAIFIDESTLFAFSRNYSTIDMSLVQFIVEHRHFMADVFFFSQSWDSMDKVIRELTCNVYYVFKGFLRRNTTFYYRIPYGIIFPDKKSGDSKLGEIVQGYSKPPWIVRLFKHRFRRDRYYEYFDSYCTYPLPPLPKRTSDEIYELEHRINKFDENSLLFNDVSL